MLRFAAMPRREIIFAIGGMLLAASALLLSTGDTVPQHSAIDASGCRVPVSIFQSGNVQTGAAVMLHGLSANRRTMFVLAESLTAFNVTVYSLDLPGHADNGEPFSFQRAEECAQAVVSELARRGEIELKRTVLVGHSMGGAIAIRMADRFDTAATIAISPAPLVRFDSAFRRVLPYDLPTRRPNNLLVLSAEYDPGDLKRATQALTNRFGPENIEDEAFKSRSALRWAEIPAATHVSLLLDHGTIFEVFNWATRSEVITVHDTFVVVTYFLPMLALPSAILLCFPGVTTGICRLTDAYSALGEIEITGRSNVWTLALMACVTSIVAVLILWFWVPLRFLRIYTGDYLASFFLISGVVLMVMVWRSGKAGGASTAPTRADVRAVVAGAAVGVVTFLAVGWWLNTQWTDAWMNAARWWRFAVLAPLLLPYFWAEERAVQGYRQACLAKTAKESRRAGILVGLRCWGMFLLLRTIAWAAMAGALWLLDSQQILIVLMTMFFLGFSALQRMGANAVGRRAGRAAAASFSAILAAWFIAAVFPLT